MKHSKTKGLVMIGSLRSAGLTTYMRQGKVVTRVSQSDERRSNTLAQFRQRQRMRHTLALWTTLRQCEPTFTQRATAYTNFMSLANRLPVVYVVRPLMEQASFLMPGLPVSDGVLPSIGQELAVVDGTTALVTSMRAGDADTEAELWRAARRGSCAQGVVQQASGVVAGAVAGGGPVRVEGRGFCR